MTKEDIFLQNPDTIFSAFLKMTQYAAEQCTGCSDSPMILAFKAQQAMLEAHEKGENPLERLNAFLGTSIPKEVLLSLID